MTIVRKLILPLLGIGWLLFLPIQLSAEVYPIGTRLTPSMMSNPYQNGAGVLPITPMQSTSSLLDDEEDPWDSPDNWADPDWEDEEEEDEWVSPWEWEEPFPTPIGDTIYELPFLIAYALLLAYRRRYKKVKHIENSNKNIQ